MAGPISNATASRPSEMPPAPRTAAGQVSAAIAAHQPSEPRSDRHPDRRPERLPSLPEPHEKYAIPPHLIPSGMDAVWLPISIMGMPNPDLRGYWQRQWRPARADQFPDYSGYGVDYGEELNAAGVMKNVNAAAPVILDQQMLVLRPKEYSEQANRERVQSATAQIKTQFERLRGRSVREVGQANTKIKRQFAPADEGEDVAEEA